jgi:hypothetical protein
MEWVEHVARMGEMRNSYKILVGKLEEKRRLERPRCRWKDNIRMDLTEIGWEVLDWMQLVWNRDQQRALVNTVMTIGFHKRRGIF